MESKLVTAIDSIENRVEHIEDNIFKNKWISIISDGVSAYKDWSNDAVIGTNDNIVFYGGTGNNTNVDNVNQMWWHQLLTKLGAKLCKNLSDEGWTTQYFIIQAGGSTFNAKIEANSTYKDLDGTEHTATNDINPDYVLIMIGNADLLYQTVTPLGEISDEAPDDNSPTTICESIEYVIHNFVRQANSNTIPILITPPLIGNENHDPFTKVGVGDNNTGYNQIDLFDKLRQIAFKWHIPFIDANLGVYAIGNEYYSGDNRMIDANYHPRQKYMTIIANQCYQQMKNMYLPNVN